MLRRANIILLSTLAVLSGVRADAAVPVVSASGHLITISTGRVLIDHGTLTVRKDGQESPVDIGVLSVSTETDKAIIHSEGKLGSIAVTSDDDGGIVVEILQANPAWTVAFSGDVQFGSRTIACRIAPEPDARITQFASGPATGLRCDSLFDIASDTAVSLVTPGQWSAREKTWRLETAAIRADKSPAIVLRLRVTPDYYRKVRGYDWYVPLDTTVFDHPPAGWCSWYIYGTDITEEEMIKNTDWLAHNLKQFGSEYVQLDDGYQGNSWTAWNKKFPHGGKWLADQIHARGLKAGLWLTPFCNDEGELVKQHPDWFIHDDKGKTIPTFKCQYTIDTSNPGVLDGWLKPLYRTLAVEWGYDYFKHDAQTDVVGLYRKVKLHRPDKRSGEAYRSGLKAIREVITPKRFMLSCSGTANEGLGVIDGTRTGSDVGNDWMGITPAYDCTRSQVFLNNIAWFCDPDVVCVRPPLTLDQARLWATMVGLTGQLFLASDKMYELPEERVEILRRVTPVAKLMPMDLYPLSEVQMDTLNVKVARPFGSWDVVGLFNWSEVPKYVHVSPELLSLPRIGHEYHVYDFWNKQYLGLMGKDLTLDLKGTSCRLLSVCAVADHPTVISTSRHITQGAVDLKSVKWEVSRKILSGESEVVGGDPYTVTLASPPVGSAYRMTQYSAKGAKASAKTAGDVIMLTLDSPESSIVEWQVEFEALARNATAPAVPGGLSIVMNGLDRAILKWSPPSTASGAIRYIVSRDGKQIAVTSECSYRDDDLSNGATYTYGVLTLDSAGQESRIATSDLRVPETRDVSLTELNPTYVRQGYGTLQKDRSVVGAAMSIGSQKYARGLGTMPGWSSLSRITYKTGGQYARFEAEVGVDNSAQGHGTVTFEVWGDGKKLYDSGLVKGHEEPKKVSVGIRDVKTLELVVTNGGDGNWWDHADWANPRLFVR